MKKKRRKTLRKASKIKKTDLPAPVETLNFPKNLYEAHRAFIDEKDEERSDMLFETRYKPLEQAYLGESGADRFECTKLSQRLSALAIKRGDWKPGWEK